LIFLKLTFCYQKDSSKTHLHPSFSTYFFDFQGLNLVRQGFLMSNMVGRRNGREKSSNIVRNRRQGGHRRLSHAHSGMWSKAGWGQRWWAPRNCSPSLPSSECDPYGGSLNSTERCGGIRTFFCPFFLAL